MSTAMIETKPFSFSPTTLDEAMNYATIISNSSVCPKEFRSNPGDVLVAIQWGGELGLSPLQALQNIAVVNGRPFLWGDAMLAIVRAHRDCEGIREWMEGDTAYCAAKRRGNEERIVSFSKEDAIRAGLWGKNVWLTYPKRMLQMRARGFCLRDTFADALKGLPIHEEAADMPKPANDERMKPIGRGISGFKAAVGIRVEDDIADGEFTEAPKPEPHFDILENVKTLIQQNNVNEETVNNWLTQAKVTKIEELSIKSLNQILNHLKSMESK